MTFVIKLLQERFCNQQCNDFHLRKLPDYCNPKHPKRKSASTPYSREDTMIAQLLMILRFTPLSSSPKRTRLCSIRRSNNKMVWKAYEAMASAPFANDTARARRIMPLQTYLLLLRRQHRSQQQRRRQQRRF